MVSKKRLIEIMKLNIYISAHLSLEGLYSAADKILLEMQPKEELPPQLNKHDCSTLLPVEKVSRVEVIDDRGRSYVSWNQKNKVELQLQDNERTLKVFVSKRQ